ncbi:DUF6470 family protein [Virgibacillus salarius]|uniref:DUF6470 family protein n=1 Tax=Virgibacillus salarius TaxID=447199 RepID=UPI002491A601|nr:DUF6470 family protein [Virgibacillus salarius]WBX78642.1 DUF6470 family protein [Virgibacillus salarius]
MKFPQLRMHSQMAKIQIEQIHGDQTIRQPKADLSIQQPRAEVTITKTPSKLEIDQTKAFADMNRMSIIKRNEQFAEKGKSAVLEGMGRRAQQGTELMKIERDGDSIVNQAVQNSQSPQKSLGIAFIPSLFSVKVNYQPSKVHIDVKTNKPIIEAKQNKVEHHYKQGEVAVSMKQYQDLTIEVVNLYA